MLPVSASADCSISFHSGPALGSHLQQRGGQLPAVLLVEGQHHRAADFAFEVQHDHRQQLVAEVQFAAGLLQRNLADLVERQA